MYCILIAGMPAAGKSSFARWLGQQRALPYLSKDEIKELLFDEIGFRSRAEKIALGNTAMKLLYAFAESQMRAGVPFLLENNFEDLSRDGLVRLLGHYQYNAVTVLFDGDTEVVYRRFLEREQSPERHRGHVVNTVYPETGEQYPSGREPLAAGLQRLADFQEGVERRGFRRFSVGGPVIHVDCTDLRRLNYEEIDRQITQAVADMTIKPTDRRCKT